jgi:hypothetical protein
MGVAVWSPMQTFYIVGVGYNFTDFSDDLTNLDYQNSGWFINTVGKI